MSKKLQTTSAAIAIYQLLPLPHQWKDEKKIGVLWKTMPPTCIGRPWPNMV